MIIVDLNCEVQASVLKKLTQESVVSSQSMRSSITQSSLIKSKASRPNASGTPSLTLQFPQSTSPQEEGSQLESPPRLVKPYTAASSGERYSVFNSLFSARGPKTSRRFGTMEEGKPAVQRRPSSLEVHCSAVASSSDQGSVDISQRRFSKDSYEIDIQCNPGTNMLDA